MRRWYNEKRLLTAVEWAGPVVARADVDATRRAGLPVPAHIVAAAAQLNR
jgi:hypothetical protein